MAAAVHETTLLDLIVDLQRHGVGSEAELIALVTELLRTGRIRLRGTYRNTSPPVT